jgi:hypothetical protein
VPRRPGDEVLLFDDGRRDAMTALAKVELEAEFDDSPVEIRPLSPERQERFDRLKLKVRQGVFETGMALLEIRHERLYSGTHSTFKEFLGDESGLSRAYAYDLIRGAKAYAAIAAVSAIADTEDAESVPLPTAEGQVRPLAALPADQQVAAWKAAVDEAGGKAPSGRQVRAAAAKVAPDRVKPPRTKAERGIAEGRRVGAIPEGAEVTVILGSDKPRAEPEPAEEPETDEQWLESLPARAKLSATSRFFFDIAALAYRKHMDIREDFRNRMRPITDAAKRQGKGRIGPWMSRHFDYLKMSHPLDWLACSVCEGTGNRPIIGDCPQCRGHGYHVPRG